MSSVEAVTRLPDRVASGAREAVLAMETHKLTEPGIGWSVRFSLPGPHGDRQLPDPALPAPGIYTDLYPAELWLGADSSRPTGGHFS